MFLGLNITVIASAASTYDKQSGLLSPSNIPQGITLDGVFDEKNSIKNNSAKVEKYPEKNTDAVRITNGPNQLGAIWSNENYKLDLTKNIKVGMWLNFGNQRQNSGDGMAFVMHNDVRGINAVSHKGQSLGVWGYFRGRKATPADYAKNAIQNSWALEFDTYMNRSTNFDPKEGFNSYFDSEYKASKYHNHIAAGYPDAESTYQARPIIHMHHLAAITDSQGLQLANGQWHHLTLDWKKPSGTTTVGKMTYTIDDMDSVSLKPQSGISQTTDIDITHFKSNKVFWGFTGSTGTYFETARVIFADVPDIIKVNQQIKASSHGQQIVPGSQIERNAPLTYEYTLTYQAGRQPWKDVEGTFNLAAFQQGMHVQVSYDGQVPEDVQPVLVGPENRTYALKLRSMNSGPSKNATEATTARIIVTGKAQAVPDGQSKKVTMDSFKFKGSNRELERQVIPAFDIEGARKVKLIIDQLNVEQLDTNNKDVEITGQVNYFNSASDQNSTAINDNKFNVQLIVNGKSFSPMPIGKDVGKFKFLIYRKDLNSGRNDFSVTASAPLDLDNPTSLPTYAKTCHGTITLSALSLEVSEKVNFKTTLTGEKREPLSPDSFHLKVTDSRANKAWTLSAKVDESNQPKLAGTFLWQSTVSTEPAQTINQTFGTILTHKGNFDFNGSAASGLFLDVHSDARAGNYSPKIIWLLADAPMGS